jgi:DNA-binding response OmpR family regulator
MLLDVMLPGEDGLSSRAGSAAMRPPIIMLSARGEEVDRIVGLEVGADDYLPKPFSHRELLARVTAVLRRRQPALHRGASAASAPSKSDLEAHCLTRNGEEVDLSGAEFALLKVLLEHPDRVLGRDALVELLKGYERAPFDRMVDVRVTRLRRKIEPDPAHPVYLRTVWGEGYLFSPAGPGRNDAPRTLFGRTALVIALVSFAFQLFTIAVITYFALMPLGRHATRDLAALMIDTAQAWQATPVAERPGLQDRIGRLHRLQVQDPSGEAESFARMLPYFRLLETFLSARAGEAVELRRQPQRGWRRSGTGPTCRLQVQRYASASRPVASMCSHGSPCC